MLNEEYFLINDQVCFYPQKQMVCSVHGDKEISLTRIVSKMLYYFCTHGKMLISYEEIMSFIWGERHKTIRFGSLYQALLVLRKSFQALDVDSDIIKTIRKAGVIFDCEVVERKNDSIGEEYIHEEESNEGGNKRFPAGLVWEAKTSWAFLLACTIATAVMAFFYYRSGGIFDDYMLATGLHTGCVVHYNSDPYGNQPHRQFIERHEDLCTSDSILYVTTYAVRKAVSVVRCRNTAPHDKNIGGCMVLYFPKGNEEGDA